jgi:hypothetical protein
MTLRAYAEQIGKPEDTVLTWKHAAEVAVLTGQDWKELTRYMHHLSYIHATPEEEWADWVERLLSTRAGRQSCCDPSSCVHTQHAHRPIASHPDPATHSPRRSLTALARASRNEKARITFNGTREGAPVEHPRPVARRAHGYTSNREVKTG